MSCLSRGVQSLSDQLEMHSLSALTLTSIMDKNDMSSAMLCHFVGKQPLSGLFSSRPRVCRSFQFRKDYHKWTF